MQGVLRQLPELKVRSFLGLEFWCCLPMLRLLSWRLVRQCGHNLLPALSTLLFVC